MCECFQQEIIFYILKFYNGEKLSVYVICLLIFNRKVKHSTENYFKICDYMPINKYKK